MEINSMDFTRSTINDVSDLLLSDIYDTGKSESTALLLGNDQDGRKYKLTVKLELVDDE